jgi:hypothetical protein
MAGSSFKTNPVLLEELLKNAAKGVLQLPDFQRSWVWDEDRIKSLIASISRGFPVGALMTLETGGVVDFKPRPVEGAPPKARQVRPESLLLDGQQRITSLYQVTLRGDVVQTITPKKKRVKRWFYIDIEKALDPSQEREDAIIGLPEDRKQRSNFGKDIDLDLSSREKEFEHLMYPVSMLFDWTAWQTDFINATHSNNPLMFAEKWPILNQFSEEIIKTFMSYQLPVISLGSQTSKEAVCVVFEKVNTGGKPLDAFELVTAMFAADGYELRKDWFGDGARQGQQERISTYGKVPGADVGVLAGITNTDFLHVVSLFHTRELRRRAVAEGKTGKDLPQVTGNRRALLNLPLESYVRYKDLAEDGFRKAAEFLFQLHIYRPLDVPYQAQVVALAAILADPAHGATGASNKAKLERWFWSGVFGELYGSTVETRIARDFEQVPVWFAGGNEPYTVVEAQFRVDRLKTMRSRLSAAYKGVNALLMREGAHDFLTGDRFDHTSFFGHGVDIHHIFPQAWCRAQGIPADTFDSIINKTPLTYQTNRKIGGSAPSLYLSAIERGTNSDPAIERETLDRFLAGHLINPILLRADDFTAFMEDRQRKLAAMIGRAIGHDVLHAVEDEEGDVVELEGASEEAEMTLASS